MRVLLVEDEERLAQAIASGLAAEGFTVDAVRSGADGLWRATEGQARARIAAGERLFNTREVMMRGVSGFNDELGRAEVVATCTSCHNTPNVGTNSEGRLMDIGVSDASRRTADLPLYTFREKSSGALVKTTDPGRALISGRWADMNRFKVPGLRGLAVRRPYFHDGSDNAALVAFLSAL
ncbi:hypothetical protein WME89_06435 [Sorangium sp. So ce321]|uniref:hypothetical protein n=1 Tax=Sorangium sp. So ce321 TaxID=3133300 RepID=UPI003F61753C